MKNLLSLKNFITLSVLSLALILGAQTSIADDFTSGEIVVRTSGDQVVFDSAYINWDNWHQKDNPFGMPRHQEVIPVGESIEISSNVEGLNSFQLVREDNDQVRVNFPLDVLEKHTPKEGRPWLEGFSQSGLGGFLAGSLIYSEVPGFLQGENLEIFFRNTQSENLVAMEGDSDYGPILPRYSKIRITVQNHPTPQVPTPNGNFNTQKELTQLDADDYLKVNLAYNPLDPKNDDLIDDEDSQIKVTYLENGQEVTETFPLYGDLEIRVFGTETNFVRAIAEVGFPDVFDIKAEANSLAFTKLEHWTRGENPELKGTFNKGPIIQVQFLAYSGNFSYVNQTPGQNGNFGYALSRAITSGDSLLLRQEGDHISILTQAPAIVMEPVGDKLGFAPGSGGNGGDNQADFDPQKDPELSLDDLNIVGGFGGTPALASGGGCTLAAMASPLNLGNLWVALVLGLPALLQRLRRS